MRRGWYQRGPLPALLSLIVLLLSLDAIMGLEMKVVAKNTAQPALHVTFDSSPSSSSEADPGAEAVLLDDPHSVASLSGGVQMSMIESGSGWLTRFFLRSPPPQRVTRLWSPAGGEERGGDCYVIPEGAGAGGVALEVVRLEGEGEESGLYVSRHGGLLAREESVRQFTGLLDSKGLKQLASLGPGARHFQGRGQVALAAWGGIIRVDMKRGQERLVRASHVVAVTQGLRSVPARKGMDGKANQGAAPTLAFQGPGTLFLRPVANPLRFADYSAFAEDGSGGRRRRGRNGDGGELISSEGLGKRLRRSAFGGVKLLVLALSVLLASLCIQTWLLEGPQGLQHVHHDLLRLLGALRVVVFRAVRLLSSFIKEARGGGVGDGEHGEGGPFNFMGWEDSDEVVGGSGG